MTESIPALGGLELLDQQASLADAAGDRLFYDVLSKTGWAGGDGITANATYTDRYFDFIEAVYERMTYLLEHKVQHYAEEACLSLYAAVSNGEKHLVKTEENAWKFDQMHRQYKAAYDHLMHHPDTGIKQKLRLVLLKYVPGLHSRIY